MELIIRFVIFLYGPAIISFENPTSDIAYLAIMSADSITWLACAIVVIICFINKIHKIQNIKRLNKQTNM